MDRITDLFLVWWLRTGRYGWSKIRRRLFEQGYLKTPLPEANSVEEVHDRLKEITWTPDGPLHLFDNISYPQMTWAKKKDDCDGFATLGCELLSRLGDEYQPVTATVMLRPFRKSHTVCVFARLDGSLSFFDNSLLKDGFTGYDRVIDEIRTSRKAERVICWDVRDHDDFTLKEFHRL